MNEKFIKRIIPLIPTILIIACVGTAFATHDWDVQATLLGDNPLKTLERIVPAESDIEGEMLEVTNFELSEGGSELILEVVLRSPLNVPVTIQDLVVEFTLNENAVTLRLPEEVEVPSRGSASLTLEGSLPEAQIPLTLPSAEESRLERMEMTLDIGGIKLKLGNLGPGGIE